MPTAKDKVEDTLLLVGSSPHIHAPGDISTIMRDVIIALVPAFVASAVFFGLRAIALVATCVGTCVLGEWLCRRAMGRANTVRDLSAIVTGLLLAFNLPPTLPFWMAVIGSLFAIVVAKQVFGGLGYNPFNPALIGRAFLLVSFTGAMTTWTATTPFAPDAITTATPLGLAKDALRAGLPPPFAMDGTHIWRFALGDINGCLGETSAIAIVLGACYLLARKVITWHTPVAFLGTVAVYAAILRLASPATAMPVNFHLLSGGLMLGACFMATDMVTSPSTHAGKVLFGIGCGILTMVIRTVKTGAYPEGVSFSILIMNAFVPLINRATAHVVFGRGKPRRKTR
jgi:electron transport complex protein RnfD